MSVKKGISTEDDHQLLQLGAYVGVSKSVFLPPTKGTMQRGGSRTRDRRVKCPRGNYHYRYADGRRKCKRCGKLFNHRPRGRRNEPPPEKRSEIARLFRLGLPAVRVILPKRCDGKHLAGAILENVELGPIVYSDGWKADNRLSFNGIHHKRINHDNPWSMARFISTAQRAPEAMLKACHGGFIRNDRLFRRERSFRFSHRDDENTLDYLQDTLPNCSVQVT